jgi:hypothetical protein
MFQTPTKSRGLERGPRNRRCLVGDDVGVALNIEAVRS